MGWRIRSDDPERDRRDQAAMRAGWAAADAVFEQRQAQARAVQAREHNVAVHLDMIVAKMRLRDKENGNG